MDAASQAQLIETYFDNASTLAEGFFFDHLIRHSENYAEKWHYVRQNPVRAGLVSNAEDWPFQGELVRVEAL